MQNVVFLINPIFISLWKYAGRSIYASILIKLLQLWQTNKLKSRPSFGVIKVLTRRGWKVKEVGDTHLIITIFIVQIDGCGAGVSGVYTWTTFGYEKEPCWCSNQPADHSRGKKYTCKCDETRHNIASGYCARSVFSRWLLRVHF